jgi:hypothetical protein
MPETQSFKNHTSRDPQFIAVALTFLINFILACYITMRDWPMHSRSHLWWIVVSFALMILVMRVRGYATKNQDRIIRLEERFRYAAVLPPAALERSAALTIRQIISLRFASDAELPALIERSVRENLTGKQIKQSITDWQPDQQRV